MDIEAKGFKYYPGFLDSAEENKLILNFSQFEWEQVSLFGQTARRKVLHFGMGYNYDLRTAHPTSPPPEFLNPLMVQCANYLNMHPEDIKEILVSKYPSNAGIGWHCDAPVFQHVIGVSLLSDCIMHFRKRADHKEKFKIVLERGSLYTLCDDMRWNWEHRITPVKSLRYSITFRTLNNFKK